MNITVLTTVYNRKKIIKKLYSSLLNQTSKNFEWLIIDDGSTDNLKLWIDEIKNDNKFKIRYFYQENGGKHRALNKGISNIESELTVIVDSDDYLELDAIESIEKYYEKYKNDSNLCGFCFLMAFPDGTINGRKFLFDEYKSNYYTCRINENNKGDKAEVFFTKCLKEYPFLEIEGEKFLSEGYVWAQLGLKYDMIFINKVLYRGEYLPDGLSFNLEKRKYESPIGFAEKSKIYCNKKVKFLKRCMAMILYITYSAIGKKRFIYQFKNIDYKILFLCMYPFSWIYRIKIEIRMHKYRN